jgi:diguanylate cyclase (GGDEF)-like protein
MIQEILRYFERTPKSLVIAIGLALLLIVGFLDLETGPQISFSIFYLIPIVLVSWCTGIAAGRWFSILGAIIWLAADLTSGQVYAQIWIPFWNMLVRLSFFIIVASTLASLKIKIEKETESARRDFLTGLANPRGFYENAEVELERATANPQPITLAFVQAEGLKWINERYGRQAGDQMLCALVETIQNIVPNQHLVARFTGTLFAILLPDTGHDAAQKLLHEIQKQLRDLTQRKYQRPMTFGIAGRIYVTPLRDLGNFMHEADRLMAHLTEKTINEIVLEVIN